ncbi:MAG: putative transposase/invertase (TIGR01784 family), partial [Phenylobacterium sp.]
MADVMAIEVFFNPDTDFGFKKLFGEEQNKHLLMSFINDLLGDAEKVVDLTLNNSEYLPSNHVLQESIFDIYCTNEKGEHFIVEMQKIKYKSFKDR